MPSPPISRSSRASDRRLVLYEPDSLVRSFHPLSLTRPVCHLRLGAGTLGSKIARAVGILPDLILARPGLEWGDVKPPADDGAALWPSGDPFLRDRRKKGPPLPVGARLIHPTIFISSGFIPGPGALDGLAGGECLLFQDEGNAIVGYFLPEGSGKLDPERLRNPSEEAISSMAASDFQRVKVDGRRFDSPWEIVDANPDELTGDIEALAAGLSDRSAGEVHPLAAHAGEGTLIVSRGAVVEPFAFLDCSRGPIYLGPDVRVHAHSRIEGPAFIDEGTRVLGARIREGCTIGVRCRVGGEIEQSILHGYDNKYHDGFLGHSYIGAWVNFGAGSTNSDLKNNYRSVRVHLPDGEVDTGRIKIGAFIGDHVRTGIGTLMTTGFVCGAGSNLYGGRGVFPRWVPSFVWGDGEVMEEYRFKEFEETTRIVLGRRGVQMNGRYRRLLRWVFEMTADERKSFLDGRPPGEGASGGTGSPSRGRRRSMRERRES